MFRFLGSVFMLCLPSLVSATNLEVIFDSGNTIPIDKYYEPHRIQVIKQNREFREDSAVIFGFPITTANMTPGIVEPVKRELRYLQMPLFLIGTDSLSKEWLIKRREELKAINAVGMLVEAEDLEDLKTIQALADGLRIFPASAHDIAKQLNLVHYPVLISNAGIEQ